MYDFLPSALHMFDSIVNVCPYIAMNDNNNTVTLKVPDDKITTLENCFLGAIKKLENVTLIDSSKILDAVNVCNSSIAKIIPQQGTNKSAEAICATLKTTKDQFKRRKRLT